MSLKGVKPAGYMLLIKPHIPDERTEGGIYLPDQVQENQQTLAVACEVVDIGPEAYKDKDRYPDGPWCKKGDWVIIGRYAGVARFRVDDVEYRFIADDKILGKVDDPTKIRRI